MQEDVRVEGIYTYVFFCAVCGGEIVLGGVHLTM